jgi:hypothetical protein
LWGGLLSIFASTLFATESIQKMRVSIEKQANILRYFHVEKWRIGTIARQLKMHHDAVRRVCERLLSAFTILTQHRSKLS